MTLGRSRSPLGKGDGHARAREAVPDAPLEPAGARVEARGSWRRGERGGGWGGGGGWPTAARSRTRGRTSPASPPPRAFGPRRCRCRRATRAATAASRPTSATRGSAATCAPPRSAARRPRFRRSAGRRPRARGALSLSRSRHSGMALRPHSRSPPSPAPPPSRYGLWLAMLVSAYAPFVDERTGELDWMEESAYG